MPLEHQIWMNEHDRAEFCRSDGCFVHSPRSFILGPCLGRIRRRLGLVHRQESHAGYTVPVQPDSEVRVLQDVGRIIRDGRRLLRLSQQDLERRCSVSQSRLSRIERGRCQSVRIVEVDRIFVSLGVSYRLDVSLPAASMVVRDSVHSRCVAYVQRRLERDGWRVVREVEIRAGRRVGWIDVLAFHPVTRMLLVIEFKTELRDIGEIERSLNGYELGAIAAAAAKGWRPRGVVTVLLTLATAANDEALRSSRHAIEVGFPGRSSGLLDLVAGSNATPRRYVASIDPRSRRRRWLLPTVLDGRRALPPYVDYIDAVRQLERPRR